ncbi:transmembrane protease serine 9-like [Brevipalpus obovatus]|uniref:transmembrane protease serine 9-like n=1 Tax=Brevipalpus obovatus TaxID=246614 RepID=UPI003D9DD212
MLTCVSIVFACFLASVSAEGECSSCGLMNLESRIFDGQTSARNRYPWLAHLRFDLGDDMVAKCGGSIIDKDTILTAAHCVIADEETKRVVDPSNVKVFVHAFDLKKLDTDNYLEVSEVIYDPLYGDTETQIFNDVAFLKLAKPIKFDKITRPVCLPSDARVSMLDQLRIAGWGKLTEEKSAHKLQETDLDFIPYKECNKWRKDFFANSKKAKDRRKIEGIDATAICARGSNGESVCSGDSGGPLMHQDYATGRMVQVGVVSYIIGDCGREDLLNTPNFYARVGKFLGAIKLIAPDACTVPLSFPKIYYAVAILLKSLLHDQLLGFLGMLMFLSIFFVAFLASVTAEQECSCGLMKLNSRVFHGRLSSRDRYPWLVYLEFEAEDGSVSTCGGSFIDNRTILTATHCVVELSNNHKPIRPENARVFLHTFDLREKNQGYLEVSKIVHDPLYSDEGIQITNDVAFLKLAEEVQFDNNLSPVCLPTDARVSMLDQLKIAGWGLLSKNRDTVNLKETDLDFIPYKKCNEWRKNTYAESDDARDRSKVEATSETAICARGRNGESVCQGDSGGPLMHQDYATGKMVAVGVVSYIIGDCGMKSMRDAPNFFARVGKFLGAIKKNAPNACYVPLSFPEK